MARYRTKCCGEIIESTYVHDFVRCSCGKSFVDGGNEYSRLGAEDESQFPVPIDEEGNDVPLDG